MFKSGLMKRYMVFLVIGVLVVSHAEAQKVKYKDLYFLLNLHRFDEAEPFLRQFLADSKNDDHVNAHYYMGELLVAKANAADVLKETDKVLSSYDSAIYYYKKSLSFLDEREIKKNDEYYQDYKRRDIRTGKFGIKLADVQLDFENKIKRYSAAQEKIKNATDYFEEAKANYAKAQRAFDSLKAILPTEKQLYLRADAEKLGIAESAGINFKKSTEAFSAYKNIMTAIPGSKYNQVLNEKEILNYEDDGLAKPDFYAASIDLWNYATFYNDLKETYGQDILPLRQQLVELSKKLEEVKKKALKDSASVKEDIPSMSSMLVTDKLTGYDPNPLPYMLFSLRVSELKFLSALFNYKKDTADIVYRQMRLKELLDNAADMDSVLNRISEVDIAEEVKNYSGFINERYGSVSGLNTFIGEEKAFLNTNKKLYQDELDVVNNRLRYVFAVSDTLPLFVTDSVTNYMPLIYDSASYTLGLNFSEGGPRGYFAEVNNKRVSPFLHFFEVNPTYFSKDSIGQVYTEFFTQYSKADTSYYFLLWSPKIHTNGYAATLTKINTVKAIWFSDLELLYPPKKLYYHEGDGKIEISYDLEGVDRLDVKSAALLVDNEGNVIKESK